MNSESRMLDSGKTSREHEAECNYGGWERICQGGKDILRKENRMHKGCRYDLLAPGVNCIEFIHVAVIRAGSRTVYSTGIIFLC